MRYPAKKFFTASVLLALACLVCLVFARGLALVLTLVALFGLGYANLFSIVFSTSMLRVPEKTNEVSSLLIVGVCGGGIIPPILGVITDTFGNQASALIALTLAWIFMVILIPFISRVKSNG